jgi:Lar family restriction alleviation protein
MDIRSRCKTEPRIGDSQDTAQIRWLDKMVGIRKQPFSAIADDQIAGLNGKSKACPFCGRHQASDKKGVLDTIEVADGRFAVACSCGASGPAETSRQEAGRAWNLRVHSDKSVCYDSHPLLPNMAPGQLRRNLKSMSFSAILQLLSAERKSGILHRVVKEKRTGIYPTRTSRNQIFEKVGFILNLRRSAASTDFRRPQKILYAKDIQFQ